MSDRNELDNPLRQMVDEIGAIRRAFESQTHELERRASQACSERDQAAKRVQTLEAELSRHRSAAAELKRKLDVTRQSVSFRLGNALVIGLTSWRGAARLPLNLLRLLRRRDSPLTAIPDPLNPRSADGTRRRAETSTKAASAIDIEREFLERGPAAVEQRIANDLERAEDAATALTQLARLVLDSDRHNGIRLAQKANALDPKPFRQKWLGFVMFDAGNILDAHRQLATLPAGVKMTASEQNKSRYIAGCARLLQSGPPLPAPSANASYAPVTKRVLYVASSSRPYHSTGYSSRTHGVAKAIRGHGWDVLCVTRPGYPADRSDSMAGVEHRYDAFEYEGVRYQALEGPHRRKRPLDEYLLESADIIASKAANIRAAIIHAASNYEAGLPALMAARRLGIPFLYEVRGLWEYTAASRLPGWENTERFALDKMLESSVVRHADRVITLTGALAEELQHRGASADRILLAENAIEPEQFVPRQRNIDLANHLGIERGDFVIGYAGSIVSYEGLDDLLAAFVELRKTHPQCRLLIVGAGNALPALRQQAEMAGVADRVVFTDRVPPADVPEYLSLVDVIALPRKPFTVCELVSPLKPFEAMAMEIPLVVSDVAALREISHDQRTALVHEAGNPLDLAACLARLIEEPGLAVRLTAAARELVRARHTWARVTTPIVDAYASLTEC